MTDSLLEDTFKELTSYLPKLISGIDACINSFRNGDINHAASLLYDILNGIDWSLEAIILTVPLHNISIDIQNVNNVLNNLSTAIRDKDYILTADMLEYEVETVFMKFIDAIEKKFGDTNGG